MNTNEVINNGKTVVLSESQRNRIIRNQEIRRKYEGMHGNKVAICDLIAKDLGCSRMTVYNVVKQLHKMS